MLDTPQVSGLESGMAYSADDRVRALIALRDCGTYSGAERATGISRETIRGWAASGSLPRARRKSPVRLAYEEKVAVVRRPCLGERAEALAACVLSTGFEQKSHRNLSSSITDLGMRN